MNPHYRPRAAADGPTIGTPNDPTETGNEMSTQPKTLRLWNREGWRAEWAGGEYIDVTPPGEIKPTETINVWNHETDTRRIPFTREALEERLFVWLHPQPDRCRLYLPDDPTERARRLEEIAAYLPYGWQVHARPMGPVDDDGRARLWAVVTGEDRAGWTLDEYVAPRLASGLLFAEPMPDASDV